MQRLLEMRALGGFRLEPGPTKQVSDSYRDMADRAIYRRGYACRIRRKGGKRIATLKGLGGAEGAVHQRTEYEVTLDGGSPRVGESPADWPASPARKLALDLSQGQPLIEIFSLSQQRHKRTVRAGDRLVAELSLDVVEMHIGDEGVILFNADKDPVHVAKLILAWIERSPVHRLRRHSRQNYTWQTIFQRDIKPLLRGSS